MCEPVGLKEIAARLHVTRQTAKTWHQRNILPPHCGMVSGSPWWDWAAILVWADKTGRLTPGGLRRARLDPDAGDPVALAARRDRRIAQIQRDAKRQRVAE